MHRYAHTNTYAQTCTLIDKYVTMFMQVIQMTNINPRRLGVESQLFRLNV